VSVYNVLLLIIEKGKIYDIEDYICKYVHINTHTHTIYIYCVQCSAGNAEVSPSLFFIQVVDVVLSAVVFLRNLCFWQ
jgi:hypothetical protein